MSGLTLTVNGEQVTLAVEPRTSLADLLRENLNLTGTHLGCEQGVCGACTILVDGVPVRSCLGTASACSGATVRTIEDFDADPLMTELRGAFNAHHGLQCGFCTPGMLIMAHDMVMRLGEADEQRIRVELAGNLCRCTGYSGIVKAIRSVMVARRQSALPEEPPPSLPLGPAGSAHAGTPTDGYARAPETPVRQPPNEPAARQPAVPATGGRRSPAVSQSFSISSPPSVVWQRFGDVPAMVRCIPGASLVSERPDGAFDVRIRIRMGPIVAEFAGTASQQRDDAAMSGVIHGAGRDAKSASLAEGELIYRLRREGDGTRVDVEVAYMLSGALAQFARTGIVTHFIGAITREFAGNLGRSLSPDAAGRPVGDAGDLRIVGSLASALKSWITDLFRRRR